MKAVILRPALATTKSIYADHSRRFALGRYTPKNIPILGRARKNIPKPQKIYQNLKKYQFFRACGAKNIPRKNIPIWEIARKNIPRCIIGISKIYQSSAMNPLHDC